MNSVFLLMEHEEEQHFSVIGAFSSRELADLTMTTFQGLSPRYNRTLKVEELKLDMGCGPGRRLPYRVEFDANGQVVSCSVHAELSALFFTGQNANVGATNIAIYIFADHMLGALQAGANLFTKITNKPAFIESIPIKPKP